MCGAQTRIAVQGALGDDTPTPWTTAHQTQYLVLIDNVRSIFNVGYIFRAFYGVGVAHIHLCGITPTPQHPKISKTSLGAERSVSWTYHRNALDAANEIKAAGASLWALENTATSESLFDQAGLSDQPNIALVVGNELTGIDPELLAMCDRVVHLPMAGVKGSLNVAVAFGIAVYWLRGVTNARAMDKR